MKKYLVSYIEIDPVLSFYGSYAKGHLVQSGVIFHKVVAETYDDLGHFQQKTEEVLDYNQFSSEKSPIFIFSSPPRQFSTEHAKEMLNAVNHVIRTYALKPQAIQFGDDFYIHQCFDDQATANSLLNLILSNHRAVKQDFIKQFFVRLLTALEQAPPEKTSSMSFFVPCGVSNMDSIKREQQYIDWCEQGEPFLAQLKLIPPTGPSSSIQPLLQMQLDRWKSSSSLVSLFFSRNKHLKEKTVLWYVLYYMSKQTEAMIAYQGTGEQAYGLEYVETHVSTQSRDSIINQWIKKIANDGCDLNITCQGSFLRGNFVPKTDTNLIKCEPNQDSSSETSSSSSSADASFF